MQWTECVCEPCTEKVREDDFYLFDGMCGMCYINGCKYPDTTVAVLSDPVEPVADTPGKP